MLDAAGLRIYTFGVAGRYSTPNRDWISSRASVIASFNDVQAARQDKERAINDAWAEYNQVVPRAKGADLEGEHLLPGFRYPIAELFKERDWD